MPRKRRRQLVIGRDYVIDSGGRAEFTRAYLLERGFCCEHDCKHCPYPEHMRRPGVAEAIVALTLRRRAASPASAAQ